ncbi:hypothetical protein pb186bvf_010963 [Paramecium bursaria]
MQQDSEEEIVINYLTLDSDDLSKIQQFVIVSYGPGALYIKQQLGGFKKIGKLLNRNVELAYIYESQGVGIILFIKDTRYFHYEEYDLLKVLRVKDKKFILLTNQPSSLLDNYDSSNSELRYLVKGQEAALNIKRLEQDNLDGYFGDLFAQLNTGVAIILVTTDYDFSIETVEQFAVIKQLVPILNVPINKEDLKSDLKIWRKGLQRDNIYL